MELAKAAAATNAGAAAAEPEDAVAAADARLAIELEFRGGVSAYACTSFRGGCPPPARN